MLLNKYTYFLLGISNSDKIQHLSYRYLVYNSWNIFLNEKHLLFYFILFYFILFLVLHPWNKFCFVEFEANPFHETGGGRRMSALIHG